MGLKLSSTFFLTPNSDQLGFGLPAALGEHLDLTELHNIERATSDNGVPGDVNGQEGGHLVARVKQVLVLVLVLEPLAGHCVIRDNTGLY